MKTNRAKVFTAMAVLAILGLLGIRQVCGQQTGSQAPARGATTNWLGYLVVGGYTGSVPPGPSDPMPGTTGPRPRTVREVQLGLRSDGVVIWRPAPSAAR